jgi:hypothetical protein
MFDDAENAPRPAGIEKLSHHCNLPGTSFGNATHEPSKSVRGTRRWLQFLLFTSSRRPFEPAL